MHTIGLDLRHGVRVLAKSPGFTTVALLTLAVGIGATTAIFSVIDAVLLRPLPYKDPDRVVMVYNTVPKIPGLRINPSPADCVDWNKQNHVFSDMAILDWDVDPVLSGTGQAVRVPGLRVSANFFSVLAVAPLLGRTFLPGEDEPGHDSVVVLNYRLWRQEFGSDSRIVGKMIKLDGQSYRVIGVMPRGFMFISNLSNTDWSKDVALWLPNPFKVTPKTLRPYHWMAVVARLKPGVSLGQAQANMEAINNALRQAYPSQLEIKGLGVKVQPIQKDLVRNIREPLIMLLAAVTLTLLIACINVANLLLARAVKRRKEVGIRLALGASRGRLIRQLLTESTLLSLAAGIVGVALALWGCHLLISLSATDVPRADTISVDFRVVAVALAVSLLTGILFGMAPAINSSKADLNQSLKESRRGAAGESLWGRRIRSFLVVSEIALSLMLLIGAGLTINSLFRLLHIDPGFDPHNITTVQLDLVRTRYADPTGTGTRGWAKGTKLWTLRPSRWTFVRDVLERIQALPGVESAAATDPRPAEGGSTWSVSFTIEGRPKPSEDDTPSAIYRPITRDYFRTMGIPLVGGRAFTNADEQQRSQPVVIIDQAVARHYFPHENPVGRYVRAKQSQEAEERAFEIVGVVGAVRESDWETGEGGLAKEPPGVMYFPYYQQPQLYADGQMYFEMKVSFLAHTVSNPATMASELRKAVWQVDNDQPIEKIQTMEQILSDSVSDRHLYATLLATFAGIALLLAVAGIYSVVSYFVSERTHEIGLRMALGAGRRDVLRLVLAEGLLLTLAGVAFGVIGAIALTRYLSTLLYQLSPVDPLTFVVVSSVLSAVALVASYIPARRATTVDPLVALRYE